MAPTMGWMPEVCAELLCVDQLMITGYCELVLASDDLNCEPVLAANVEMMVLECIVMVPLTLFGRIVKQAATMNDGCGASGSCYCPFSRRQIHSS